MGKEPRGLAGPGAWVLATDRCGLAVLQVLVAHALSKADLDMAAWVSLADHASNASETAGKRQGDIAVWGLALLLCRAQRRGIECLQIRQCHYVAKRSGKRLQCDLTDRYAPFLAWSFA